MKILVVIISFLLTACYARKDVTKQLSFDKKILAKTVSFFNRFSYEPTVLNEDSQIALYFLQDSIRYIGYGKGGAKLRTKLYKVVSVNSKGSMLVSEENNRYSKRDTCLVSDNIFLEKSAYFSDHVAVSSTFTCYIFINGYLLRYTTSYENYPDKLAVNQSVSSYMAQLTEGILPAGQHHVLDTLKKISNTDIEKSTFFTDYIMIY